MMQDDSNRKAWLEALIVGLVLVVQNVFQVQVRLHGVFRRYRTVRISGGMVEGKRTLTI